MKNDDLPPLDAILSLIAMLAAWFILLPLIYSYKFDAQSVRIYFLGIRFARIPVENIEWVRITTLFDVLGGNVPYPSHPMRTLIFANSFFRKIVMIKTSRHFFWCLTPKNPEEAIDSLCLKS